LSLFSDVHGTSFIVILNTNSNHLINLIANEDLKFVLITVTLALYQDTPFKIRNL